ncbi:hypothetical protein [Ruminococcus sp.]|uniref:hypothetical protein n=1 Tax=Ruminococcus sp. TaxID=41978 RepID=UPI00386D557A
MKKTTIKTIIASLLIAAVAGTAAMALSACSNNTRQNTNPTEIVTSTDKAEKKNADLKKKDAKTETQAPTVKATVKPTVKPTEKTAAKKTAAKPTVKPTEKPTEKPAAKPAVKPTEKTTPAVKPTEKPTPAVKPTEKPAPAPTQAPTVKPTEKPVKPATPDEATNLYTTLKNTIKDSKAEGYKIVSIKGTDAKVLVLTFGKEEAKKSFKFYTIGKKDVTSVGKLSAANVTAYTDKESGKLCLYATKDGEATYNTVKLDKDTVKLTAMTDNTAGKAVKFLPTNDFTDLNQFK